VVGTLARIHLKPLKSVREAAEADPLIAIAGGGGVNLFNSQGNAWTADYLKITGELDVDLRSNIAAEARAKIVYERLINFCRDAGSRDALQFLMTREITHMRAFTAALESMGKPPFVIGRIAPTPKLVDQFFNDSTGEGDYGDLDSRGPWNEGPGWEYVQSPALVANGNTEPDQATAAIHAESTGSRNDAVMELLVDQLRDLLHAEKQLTKALPKLAKAARSDQLQRLFTLHLQETEGQVERLSECLRLLEAPARAKACNGMAGLIEEGEEVIEEGKDKEDAPADLALIGAAQRVEHYEIAAYTTARNLAVQMRDPTIVQLLTASLGEEQNTGQLLDQLAQPLLSVARMPAAVE
jgi:Mn-containing catalase